MNLLFPEKCRKHGKSMKTKQQVYFSFLVQLFSVLCICDIKCIIFMVLNKILIEM